MRSRIGTAMCVLAIAISLIACLRDIDAPWSQGFRGWIESKYTESAVANTLTHGLRVTRGLPVFVVPNDGDPVLYVNFHHPPAYWLWVAGWAWLFGQHTWVLRAAHLVLYLPGILALFLLVRRAVGPVLGGTAALLFATSPLLAYFGPMVVQDGTVIAFGLWTMWSFHGHLEAPSPRTWWRTAALFFVATTLDIQGHFWGLSMFVLALCHDQRRRAVRSVFSFFPVSVLAFSITAVHYGCVLGGPLGYLDAMLGLAQQEVPARPGAELWSQFLAALHELMVHHYSASIYALALLGFALSRRRCFGPRLQQLPKLAALGFALSVPGVLNCALFFPHALMHVMWSMHGFAGLAAFATIVPVVGVHLVRTARPSSRVVGALLVLATVGMATAGAIQTHLLIDRHRPDHSETAIAMRKVAHLFDGCAVAMTTGSLVAQTTFGATAVFGEITTVPFLEGMLQLGRGQNYKGDFAFVLLPDQGTAALKERLDSMGKGIRIGDILVYRLRL